MTVIDASERAEALDPTRSFCVVAPAGSGKTELLTQRILCLLATVEQPEEIVAITFTKKAAAEMQDRLLKALIKAHSVDPEQCPEHERTTIKLSRAVMARNAEKDWRLLDSPSRLRIQTIDSLCSSISRQKPVLSGFGSQMGISDVPRQMYLAAAEDLLQQIDKDGPVADALAQLLLYLDNRLDRLRDLFADLLARREQWLPHIGRLRFGSDASSIRTELQRSMVKLVEDQLREAHRLIHGFAPALWPCFEFAATQLQAAGDDSAALDALQALLDAQTLPAAEADALNLWQNLVDTLMTTGTSFRKSVNKNNGYPVGEGKEEKALFKQRKQEYQALLAELAQQAGLDQALLRIRELAPPRYSNKQFDVLLHLIELLPRLSAHLQLQFQRSGEVDYSEVSRAAIDALGDNEEPSELALRLDYRISHILIDEFQDTAQPQYSLLNKLMRGWQPGDGNTLFVVGDGMQSIYGFRDANVGLFINTRERGFQQTRMQTLALQVNFRSQKNVIDWVNHHFRGAFPAYADSSRGAVDYADSVPFNAALAGQAVAFYAAVDAEDRSAEAQQVVALIEAARRRDAEGSIAVLVRTRGQLREIIPAMQAARLRWQSADIDPLMSRPFIVDLLTLCRAMQRSYDSVAWMALLRSPLCGLRLQALLSISEQARRDNTAVGALLLSEQYIDGLDADVDSRQRLDAMRPVLRQAWRQRQRKSPRIWLEGLWHALGGTALLSDESARLDAETFFRCVEQYSEAGNLPEPEAFEERIRSLYAAADSAAPASLQLMTIHKSKGLEFDTVILPGLDKSGRGEDKALLIWQEYLSSDGEQGLLMSPIAMDEDSSQVYRMIEGEQKRRRQLENTRLLYVAATRAVKHLYLLANIKAASKHSADNPSYKAPAKDSLLASIWDSVQADIIILPEQLSVATSAENAAENSMKAASRPLQRFALSDYRQLLGNTIEAVSGDIGGVTSITDTEVAGTPVAGTPVAGTPVAGANIPEREQNTLARHTGTVIHRLLQHIVESGTLPAPDVLIELQQRAGYLLANLGVNEVDRVDAVEKVMGDLRATLNSESGPWVLDSCHRDSLCEWPVSVGLGGSVAHLVVDRSFVDGDGVRWIIDYKTAEPGEEQTLDDFIADEVIRYRSQLLAYRSAFTESDIRTALFFTALGRLEVLS